MSPGQLAFSWSRNAPLDALRCDLFGTSLIEASAGTGKTYAITTLYLRLLLERELDVGQILVVTYTRAATAELRDRIRRRLRQALRALEAGCDEDDSEMDTLIKTRMRKGTSAADQKRLAVALRSFDQASIFTIHSFCQRVLQDSAFESGAAFDTAFLSDQKELVAEIGNDFWARELYGADPERVRLLTSSKNAITPAKLIDLAKKATPNPSMPILPDLEEEVVSSALESWASAQQEAAAIWREQRAEILGMLDGSEVLKKNQYPPGKITEMWGASMDQTLRPGNVGIPADFTHFHKFTPAGLAAGTKKYCVTPAHPFFEACNLLQELSALTQKARLATYIKSARYARKELAERKQSLAVQSFDDLLFRLAAALESKSGPKLVAAMRSRFPAALIDEFQDTDPMQYKVFSRVYTQARSKLSLFLIGDPKQAIYAFRGADLYAYMDARKDAGEKRHTLGTNWRSDPKLIKAVNTIFESANRAFVFDEIGFKGVEPSPKAKDGLLGLDDPAALQIVFVERKGRKGRDGRIPKGWGNREVPGLTAHEIADLLSSGATIPKGENQVPTQVSPGDIAVLVRKNQQALDMQEALRELGIPSVVEGNASVFETAEAIELERILLGIAQPSNGRALVSALTTPTMGVRGDEVSALQSREEEWDQWLGKFREWHKTWDELGFIQAYRRLLSEQEVPQRLLATLGGERRLTNLYHLGELLQAQAVAQELGPQGLLQWMYLMRTDASARAEGIGDTGLMRLESDANAVKLVTIHKSKGLEYPIVYCPFLWDGKLLAEREKNAVRFHDAADGQELKLDIGSEDLPEHRRIAEREALAENLRLLYVALTRAKHMSTVVWGGFNGCGSSPLGYLWHQDPEASDASLTGLEVAKDYVEGLDDEALLADLERLCTRSEGALSVRPWVPHSAEPYQESQASAGQLRAREAKRFIYAQGRFSSFSALVSSERGEGEERDIDSMAQQKTVLVEEEAASGSEESPRVALADFPKGARIGVMMHEVFENTDFADESGSSLARATEDAFARYGLGMDPDTRFLPAMQEVLATPLVSDRVPAAPRLGDLGKKSRLDELEFLFPVSETGSALSAGAIARVLATYPDAAWPSSYLAEVAKLDFLPLKGFMRGFIDLIFCHEDRWYLADYKSNFLGATVADYRPESLDKAMASHHYFLQYLVYIVALHRYLQARLPDYDYDKHIGGVFYFFVRGMSPDNPPGSGVFADRPPAALVAELSRLFDGAAS
jgi:exodeoxyribonuclease V beta subunit